MAVSVAFAADKVLNVDVLKVYMASKSDAAVDVRFTNSTPDDLRYCIITLEAYKGEKYLGFNESLIRDIPAGASRLDKIVLPDIQASDITTLRMSGGGVRGYSKLEGQYSIKVKNSTSTGVDVQ